MLGMIHGFGRAVVFRRAARAAGCVCRRVDTVGMAENDALAWLRAGLHPRGTA
jgi:hypothetical protein